MVGELLNLVEVEVVCEVHVEVEILRAHDTCVESNLKTLVRCLADVVVHVGVA